MQIGRYRLQSHVQPLTDSRFLLARLHVDQLSAMAVPAHAKKAISRMFRVSEDKSQIKKAYNERYDLALERITHQPGHHAELAQATLAWVTFAYRPLRPAELCHAIAMDLSDDQSDLSQDYIPRVGLLVSKCAGLVTVDEQADVVRPVHYTTQEYLERSLEKWFPACKKHLASTCLSYLLLDEFKKGGREPDDDADDDDLDQDRLRRYPFFRYVAHHWGKHVQVVEDQVAAEILTILQNPKVLDSISSVTTLWIKRAEDERNSFFAWALLDPLLIVARDGLLQTLQYYLTNGHYAAELDKNTHRVTRFLPAAAANGHLDIVQLILDFWADRMLNQSQPLFIEHISEAKDMALEKAAKSDHQQIMRILIQHGAHIGYCMTASSNGDSERSLRLALQLGFEVDARDYSGNTALQIAANRDYFQLARILLEHRADPQAKSKRMGPPLEEAVCSWNLNTLELLIDHGIDVDCPGWRYDTALIAAICEHYEAAAVQLLLKAGAQPDKRHREEARTALCIASHEGKEEVCELLILHGADINLRSGAPLQSALEAAYKAAKWHVLQLLLNNGAQAPECGVAFSGEFMHRWVHCRQNAIEVLEIMHNHNLTMDFEGNGAYLPAIYEAARASEPEVLEELLNMGADISSRAGEHGNVLHTAITAKCIDVPKVLRCIRVLLDHGADVNGSGLIYTTPLEAAVKLLWWIADDVFELLVEHGAQVGSHGPTLLQAAVAGGCVYIVQYLLTTEVDLRNFPAFPNLLAAACKGGHCVEILTMLMDAGADIHMWGPDALQASSMRPEVVRWLLQHGVDANAPGNEYSNALLACVSSSQKYYYIDDHVADSIKTLIEYGADLKIHGPAALELARANGWSGDVIRLLGGTDSDDD
jgi:ankyrin repeat protein